MLGDCILSRLINGYRIWFNLVIIYSNFLFMLHLSQLSGFKWLRILKNNKEANYVKRAHEYTGSCRVPEYK
jgi:hypothetical protein